MIYGDIIQSVFSFGYTLFIIFTKEKEMKKILTIISLIAMISLLASLFVMPASAEIVTGSCGEGVTYSLNVGTHELTISGTGAMDDSLTVWNDYKASILTVTINEGVTAIGKRAFAGFGALTTVSIPSSVQSIGYGAFSDCIKLDGVVLPEGITTIDKFTFAECYALTSIVIPDSVTVIKDSAFNGAQGLKKLHIGTGVTTIEADAFLGCAKLETISLSTNVTTIGKNAFASATKLKTINYYCGTAEQWNAIKANFKGNVTPNFHLNDGTTEVENTENGYICAACHNIIIDGAIVNPEDLPAATTEEATTEATTEAVETTTAAEDAEKSGCGASVAVSALIILPTLAGGALLAKKRKED